MGELIRVNMAMRDPRPLAGSRMHYSLVDGGKWQDEEMPGKETQKVTFADLQAEEKRRLWKFPFGERTMRGESGIDHSLCHS